MSDYRLAFNPFPDKIAPMAITAKHRETVFFVGDTVAVRQKIIESGKERTQNFEGVVISIRGRGENKTFTVRRIAADRVGVERVWPLGSPWVLDIKVLKSGKSRRAKLFYLRERVGSRALKVKTRPAKKPATTPKTAGGSKKKTGK